MASEECISVAQDGSDEELDVALENVLTATRPTLLNSSLPPHTPLISLSIPFLDTSSLPSDRNTWERASTMPTSVPESLCLASNSPTLPKTAPFGLTFSFPGWGVDICRDSKCRKPSILRHALNPVESNVKISQTPLTVWSGGVLPSYSCPVFEVPNEVLNLVFMRLEIRDLCSVMHTCRRWQRFGSADFLWQRFILEKGFDDNATAKLSRRLFVKNYTLSSRVSSRYTYFRKGYDHLRSALNYWWEFGGPDGRYRSSTVHSLIRKLTAQDWSLVYEAFGAAFSHRSDCLATALISALEKVRTGTPIVSKGALNNLEHRWSQKVPPKFVDACKGLKDEKGLKCEPVEVNCDTEDFILDDRPAEKELWRLLYSLWNRYKCWLTLILSHCANLNHEVTLERARSIAFSATPSVYDKGVISFRGQVVLRFELRGALQARFSLLTTQDRNGSLSDTDVELLRSLHHMLQELDVPDDYTLCENTFTQLKLRRSFTIPRPFNHKLIQPCPKVKNLIAT